MAENKKLKTCENASRVREPSSTEFDDFCESINIGDFINTGMQTDSLMVNTSGMQTDSLMVNTSGMQTDNLFVNTSDMQTDSLIVNTSGMQTHSLLVNTGMQTESNLCVGQRVVSCPNFTVSEEHLKNVYPFLNTTNTGQADSNIIGTLDDIIVDNQPSRYFMLRQSIRCRAANTIEYYVSWHPIAKQNDQVTEHGLCFDLYYNIAILKNTGVQTESTLCFNDLKFVYPSLNAHTGHADIIGTLDDMILDNQPKYQILRESIRCRVAATIDYYYYYYIRQSSSPYY